MNITELVKQIAESGPLSDAPKGASGVYVIVNRITCRAYIGQTRNFANRAGAHFTALRAGRHSNKGLQAAWNECGEAAFLFCPVACVDIDRLLEEERRLIGELENAYNNDELVCSPNDRGQGRKPKSATGEVMKPRLIRFTDSGWEDAKLIGMDRLRELVRKAAAKLRKE